MASRHEENADDARAAEEAGATEAFADAALYDWEYRRRRADVAFYRRLAAERLGFGAPAPILDLACGTGRLLVPFLRDGHTVVGLDRSPEMLARAAAKVRRLTSTRQRRGLLVRGDLRRFAFAPRFAFAVAAFHSVQHLVLDADLVAFFRCVRRSLVPDGWFAFDVLPPDPRWIHRDPRRRWARTRFRHPTTGQRLLYTVSQHYDPGRRALHMRIHYQPLDEHDEPVGTEHSVRLCHRQLAPDEIDRLLARAGLRLLASYGGFDGRPLSGVSPPGDAEPDDEHIYLARPR